MPKFSIMLVLTESRCKELTIDAATSEEADEIAQRAIDDAIENDMHQSWETGEIEFSYDISPVMGDAA